jgi:hypothetical protein
MRFALVRVRLFDAEQGDALAFPGACQALLLGQRQPRIEVLFPGIPFHDEVDAFVGAKPQAAILGIVARVQAHQQARVGQAQRGRNHPFQGVLEFVLAVLLALAQFVAQAPAFVAEIGRNRRIAVKPFIGPGDTLLAGFLVVHRVDVDVQGDVPGGERRDRDLGIDEKVDVVVV